MTRRSKTLGIIGLVVIITVYAVFQGYDLIRGPILEVKSPENGSSFSDPAIEIEGLAKNISFIYLNDKQIFVDPEGNFKEKLLLLPGYNIITLSAKDRFNREVSRELHLILSKHGSQEKREEGS